MPFEAGPSIYLRLLLSGRSRLALRAPWFRLVPHAEYTVLAASPGLRVCYSGRNSSLPYLTSVRLSIHWPRGCSMLPGTASFTGYAKSGPKGAWYLYQRKLKAGISPDDRVFVAVLKACAGEGELTRGKMVHAHILECGLESNVFVGNTLIHMYAKCGSLEDARKVFDGLTARDLVSWNAMIAGYAQRGSGQEALQLFQQMQDEGMSPDKITFLSAVKACSNMDDARRVHSELSKLNFDLELPVGNTLINMYARCGSLTEARRVFDKLPHRDGVSWNAMITAYVKNEHAGDGLRMFWQMQQVGWDTDRVALISSLKACSSLEALDEGYTQDGSCELSIQLYKQMQVEGLEVDEVTVVSILKACSTTGALDEGYVQDGDCEKAIELYKEMQLDGIHPDQGTLTSVLQACSGISALAQALWMHGEFSTLYP